MLGAALAAGHTDDGEREPALVEQLSACTALSYRPEKHCSDSGGQWKRARGNFKELAGIGTKWAPQPSQTDQHGAQSGTQLRHQTGT